MYFVLLFTDVEPHVSFIEKQNQKHNYQYHNLEWIPILCIKSQNACNMSMSVFQDCLKIMLL